MLVANAGITRDTLILRMSEDDWASVIDTNLTGSFRVAKRAAKGMLRLRRGRIVFISSVVGLLGSAGQVNYAASKAGLVGMARSLARELGSPLDHRQRRRARLRRDRHDRGAARGPEGRDQDARSRWAATARPRRSAGACAGWPATAAATSPAPSIPVDGGLGMGH